MHRENDQGDIDDDIDSGCCNPKGYLAQSISLLLAAANIGHTIGIHLPVQISHGRGISHSKMMPVMTASVHIKTTTPMIMIPSFCNVLSAVR